MEVNRLLVRVLVRLEVGEMILQEAVAVVLLKVKEVVKSVSIVGKLILFDVRTQPFLYIKLLARSS